MDIYYDNCKKVMEQEYRMKYSNVCEENYLICKEIYNFVILNYIFIWMYIDKVL